VGRNRQQNERARDERRERIMDAALRLFTMRGLGTTRVSDIARAAGTSQGLLYHYFESKEAIYAALIREAYSRMNAAAAGLAELGTTPRQKIERALEQLLAEIESSERFAYHVLLMAQAAVSDGIPAEARQALEASRQVPYDVVAGILQAGQAAGSVREHDARDLSVLFWSMIRGLALYRAGRGRLFERSGAELLEAVFLKEDR
jgi:AcrR family transcriptional regulator